MLGPEIAGLENLQQFNITVPLRNSNFYDLQIQRRSTKLSSNYLIYYEGIIDTSESYDSPHEEA